MKQVIVFILGVILLSTNAWGQDNGKISGYMFGDIYYMAANHNKAVEGNNGIWVRRVYLTYDKNLNEDFSVRLRYEMNTVGDFTTKSKMAPVIKDAYLKWKKGGHTVYLGISPTPTWSVVEKVWGYRSVEKTALDLQKFGSSRDFGIAVKGSFDADKVFNYHVQIANGNSNSSENNKGKKYMLSLTAKTKGGFIVEGYVDFDERPEHASRTTLQGFAGYQSKTYRFGLQLAQQNRQVQGADDDQLRIASVFGAAKFSETTSAFARVDRTFQANSSGEKISYIPFDKTAESTFIVAGLDFTPIKNVHLMPNIEAVTYGKNDAGVTPDTDIIPRLSFYFKF
jgi:Phosphate-selective porin O and P